MGEDLSYAFSLMLDEKLAQDYLASKKDKLLSLLGEIKNKGMNLGYAQIHHNAHDDTYIVSGRKCNSKTCAIAYIVARWH